MNKKILVTFVVFLIVAMIVTPLALAKPWEPKNNDKFEEFLVEFGFDFVGTAVPATFAAIADMNNPNKVVIIWEEDALSYDIWIGEAGPDQRHYDLDDFTYTGVATLTVYNPILPYDPFSDPPFSLFLPGSKHHFRVDYTYDFGDGDGGLDGTLTMVALITGNALFLSGEKPMWITSLQGTGDFKNVNIKSTAVTPNHMGIVSGWPE